MIDVFASDYGWSKDVIFGLFPQEAEILVRRINERNALRNDVDFVNMIIAARVPMMEDHGQGIINTIMAKRKTIDEEPVTAETIAKELALARAMLAR